MSKYPTRQGHLLFLKKGSKGTRVTHTLIKKYPQLFPEYQQQPQQPVTRKRRNHRRPLGGRRSRRRF